MSSVAVPVSSLPRPSADELRRYVEAELADRIPGALSPRERALPEMASSGIAALDELTGGWPRGTLSEWFGPASSGRTSILYAALAAATARGELCALVDAGDAFDPESAAAAGVDLKKLLWVRCGKQNPPHRHRDTEKYESKKNRSGMLPVSPRLRCELIRTPEPRDIGIWGYGDTETMERINPALARKNKTPPQRRRDAEKQILFCHSERGEGPAFQFGNSAVRQFGNRRGTKYRAAYARIEQTLKAADLLLGGGGFGMVALDFAGLPPEAARRVPLTTWFRFRRAVEATSTVLLVVSAQPLTQSCAALSLKLQPSAVSYQPSAKAKLPVAGCQLPDTSTTDAPTAAPLDRQFDDPSHTQLLNGFRLRAEVIRSPLAGRKHPRAAETEIVTEARWA